MLGPDRQRLEHLEKQLPPSAKVVSAVLPEAVSLATDDRPAELAIAAEPTVTSAVRTVARREPDLFGEILSPTIGAAVRKAVADAIAAILQRFDRALEESLSLRGLRWRLEARRTGRPFAEVVLLRTLVYQVEQVLLIRPQSGLLLQHAAAPGVVARDPDQVAAMLEAIESFVRDAFDARPAATHLSSMQVGDLTVWVDRGPSLAVAAVVRGVAPREYGDLLRETRERIALAHPTALARFASDPAELADARPVLQDCLRAQRRAPPRRAHLWIAAILVLGAAGSLVFWVRSRELAAEQVRQLEAYVQTLEPQPGIAVISAQRVGDRVRIRGIRDVLAASPRALLARRGLPPAELRFEPFYSLDAAIVARRAERALEPPASVTLALHEGVLRVSGTAPQTFIERARTVVPALPGIERYDDAALRSEQALAALRAAAAELTALELPFARASTEFTARAPLERARERTRALLAAASEARYGVCITVVGHADQLGSHAANVRFSELRAQRVAAALRALGVHPDALQATGAGVRAGVRPARARTVTFAVGIGATCTERR